MNAQNASIAYLSGFSNTFSVHAPKDFLLVGETRDKSDMRLFRYQKHFHQPLIICFLSGNVYHCKLWVLSWYQLKKNIRYQQELQLFWIKIRSSVAAEIKIMALLICLLYGIFCRSDCFLKCIYFFSFFFFSFIFISWRLITLQYCSGFCHTLTWISHGFTCIPHPDPPSHLPLDLIPQGRIIAILCWFPPHINKGPSWVYIHPLALEPPPTPSHPSGFHRALAWASRVVQQIPTGSLFPMC